MHRKAAIFGWLAFVIITVAVGTGVGLKQIDSSNGNVGQAHTADRILTHAGFKQAGPVAEMVAIQSEQRTISDPAFRGDRNCRHRGGRIIAKYPRAAPAA